MPKRTSKRSSRPTRSNPNHQLFHLPKVAWLGGPTREPSVPERSVYVTHLANEALDHGRSALARLKDSRGAAIDDDFTRAENLRVAMGSFAAGHRRLGEAHAYATLWPTDWSKLSDEADEAIARAESFYHEMVYPAFGMED